jgi:hypothetical protein
LDQASPVALELAEVLLRFSNEQRAAEWHGERGRLVQDGRYAKEAAMLSKAQGIAGITRCGQTVVTIWYDYTILYIYILVCIEHE